MPSSAAPPCRNHRRPSPGSALAPELGLMPGTNFPFAPIALFQKLITIRARRFVTARSKRRPGTRESERKSPRLSLPFYHIIVRAWWRAEELRDVGAPACHREASDPPAAE